ncbi:2-keto-3-deoxy-phosphogluconate aldolase [Orenia metallireducens]|uniref:2-keto-3-deoxy-phosphogluconate aldolase n=1 Tax=Orenia metallireducens TaxID=1413210 RepID=A0A285GAK5_9FIRM|nr:bifunctional 2-keto-4-hydroxyglutarate aldolase/2-keto-3-deoxy-6-phosphogluconate aldolase [Orenia metallireducens]PRX28276.1 2-keto-3-deoxy-phosphogluconate aldolase [Orenia metallireducens]SNY19556.1 2-keto-3-deoxy-phosphogluconate aldolase [Orenia metallireducens]
MDKQIKLKKILDKGVVPVLRTMDTEKMFKAIEALNKGGIDVFEITLDNPAALDVIKELSIRMKDTDVLVGAGTVLDGETARAAILAGAEFIFCPTFNKDVIDVCNRYAKVVIPGVMTPTEAINAYQAGADLVKVFPAGVLGPKYIKSIKGPLPHISIISTGGINLDNAADFIKAGVEGIGAGGSLVDKEAINNENYEELTKKAKQFIEIVQEARG